MIQPEVREALERARDCSDHRSVTIKRDHLRHVLEKDEESAKAGRVMAGLIRSQTEDIDWERRVSAAERAARAVEVAALEARIDEARLWTPFPFMGAWSWPLLLALSAIGGALAR